MALLREPPHNGTHRPWFDHKSTLSTKKCYVFSFGQK